MAWYDSILNYGANNPLEALSLGVGAAGTGMGIYDMMRARQAQADRQKQIEELYRQGPESFMPRQTSAQLAAFLKPYQSDLAVRGIDPSGGAGQSALADAVLRNYMALYRQGADTYGQKVRALGLYGDPQATGDTGAFGKALAYAMLSRAAAQRRDTTTPGAADTSAFTAQRAGERDPYPLVSMDLTLPDAPQFSTSGWGGGGGSGFQGHYELTGPLAELYR